MKDISFAVIGVGRMGSNHDRVLSEMEGVRLQAICDSNKTVAKREARRHLVGNTYNTIEELLSEEELDAAVVALPTSEHRRAAELLIDGGIHILLEKPMASSVDECEEILSLAKSKCVHVFTGHIERYNPVIMQLKKH